MLCSDSLLNICYCGNKTSFTCISINKSNEPKHSYSKYFSDPQNVWLDPVEYSIEECKYICILNICITVNNTVYILGKSDNFAAALSIYCYSLVQGKLINQWNDDNLPIPVYDMKPYKDGVLLLCDQRFVFMRGASKDPKKIFTYKFTENITDFKDGACMCKYKEDEAVMLTSAGNM